MRIIAFIEQPHIIKKIVNHLNMGDVHNHGPPTPAETTTQLIYDDEYSQIPPYEDWIQ